MTRIVIVALFLSAATPGLAEDYTALFEEAAAAIEWDIQKSWAFTETRLSDDKRWVARFDPRRPDGEKWHLRSVDGRAPTSDELRKFGHDKEEHDTSDDNSRIEVVQVDTLELKKETDSHWLLGFEPNEEKISLTENIDAIVAIRKDGRWIEAIDIHNLADIEPGFATKISYLSHSHDFRTGGRLAALSHHNASK